MYYALGIPTSRDKIVQAGVALILEALYESLFRNCSHGFRPNRSPITALRPVATAYKAGATWIIEGDLEDCFGRIPHHIILNCLRKRIRDERFIEVVNFYLKTQMGLTDFRVWSYEAVDRYMVVVHLTWAYVEQRFERERSSQIKTYGDLVRQHRDEHAIDWLSGAIHMAIETGDVKAVLQRFLRLEALPA
jgi:hypothetical protein